MKLTRWFLPALFAVFLTFILVVPVLAAAINDPDDMDIHGVYVYRNCREEGDQLYLIDYTIDYSVIGNPTECATETFICRLMDDGTEIRGVAPYAYYNDGYDRGVVAIYFSATDAPTWHGDCTIELAGNPLLDWEGGDFSSVSVSVFNLWQDNEIPVTQTVVSSRILYLADTLELAWTVDMVTATAGGHILTPTYGEDYFTNVVPYLADIAPYALSGTTIQPEIPDIDESADYAQELEANILDTPLDMTDLANDFGVERGALTAILYYGAVALGLGLLVQRAQSTRPAMIAALPAVIFGAFVGVPLIVTVLVGVFSAIFITYSIWYKPSTT